MPYTGLSQHIDFGKLPSPGDRFQLKELIGEGTYGEVYSARDKQSGHSVAIKVSESHILQSIWHGRMSTCFQILLTLRFISFHSIQIRY